LHCSKSRDQGDKGRDCRRRALESVWPALLEHDFAALIIRPEAVEKREQAHHALELDRAFLAHGETLWNQ
jgi:hypothetical protein